MRKKQLGIHQVRVVTPEELAEMLGPGPRTVEVITPQFERTKEQPTPSSAPDFSRLDELDATALREMGCERWNDPNEWYDWPHPGKTLYMFPWEWYDHIPIGTHVVDIFGREESFIPGETDNDKRYGLLAFGVLRPS